MITNFTKQCDIVVANISGYHRELIVTLAALLFYIHLSNKNGWTVRRFYRTCVSEIKTYTLDVENFRQNN